MFFCFSARYLLESNKMNDDDKSFDEELNEFLFKCYRLKKKAELAQQDKKSLPAWLIKLLASNKPSQN